MKEKLDRFGNRIVTNFKNNRIAVIVLLVIWVLTVIFTLFSYKDTLGKISSGNEAFDQVVELCDDLVVTETLPIVEDSDAIVIKFATYARKNQGSFNVQVIGNKSGKVYADKTVRANDIQDNAFVTFALSEKLNSKNDPQIRVVVTALAEESQGAGIYYSNIKAYEGSTLLVGKQIQEGDLSLRFMNESAELNLFYHIVITWVITTFSLILLLILLVKPKYEILFTVIAIAFGLTFWLIITPMSVPDETIHYEYSFQISNYLMGAEDHMVFDEEYENYSAFAGHYNISAAYERFIKKIDRPLNLDEREVRMRYDVNDSYAICFIPQGLGITVARLLNWNMLRTFYTGRLFNLIFYIICLYIAIRNTPVHKVLFGILATLPIFMQQAASYSYDCYINGLTFVIIAFLMKWIYGDGPISRKEFLFVFIVNLMIAPVKVVYGLFTFLYWFTPRQRFGGLRQKIIAIAIITAPAMYQLGKLLMPLVLRIVSHFFEYNVFQKVEAETITGPLFEGGGEGDTYSFSDVLWDPLSAVTIILRTIRYSLKTWFYASFGRALSGNTLILPTRLGHGLLLLLLLVSVREEAYADSLLFKAAILFLCAFAGMMMVGGMLISWTEVDQTVIEAFGGPIIQGVQGRYFSPLLPYLFLIFHNKWIRIPEKYDQYLLSAFVLLVFEVIVYVLSYTFMN